MRIFLGIASIAEKRPVKVISITFLFREIDQKVVYQLLPNLAILEQFGWLSSGSELVDMWGPL